MPAKQLAAALLERLTGTRSRRLRRRTSKSARPEELETRELLSSITVTMPYDLSRPNDGRTSLREAIALANADPTSHDVITFDESLGYKKIELLEGQLEITGSVTIDASAAGLVRIGRHSRVAAHRIMKVAPGADVELRRLVIQDGELNVGYGAGIHNSGTLELQDSIVGGNLIRNHTRISRRGTEISFGGGGGIYNASSGQLRLTGTRVGSVPLESELLDELDIDSERFRVGNEYYFVYRNSAEGIGGGILNEGSLRLSDGSSVYGNRSMFGGGGIYNVGSSEITGSEISRNLDVIEAHGGVGSEGTGILNTSGVRQHFLTAGSGRHFGYEVRTTTNTPALTIRESTISDHSGWRGGAVYSHVGNVTVENSTFSGNRVDDSYYSADGGNTYAGGAAIYIDSGDLTVAGSTFAHNKAISLTASSPISAGGAVFVTGPRNVTIETSTFSDNEADRGGAIYSSVSPNDSRRGRPLNLVTSTITNNTARDGGGVYLANSGVAVFGFNIIADNHAPANPNITVYQTPVRTGGYNLIGPISATGGFRPSSTDLVNVADPRIGPLGDYGGSTQTHSLLPDSPALNSVGDTNVYSDTDQRGYPRVHGPAPDRGAFEAQPPETLRVDTLSDEVDGFYGPGELSLREALLWAKTLPGPDTIGFADELIAGIRSSADGTGTITLNSTLSLDHDVTIAGPGADLIAISGDDRFGVVEVAAGSTVALYGLTIRDGYRYDSSGAGVNNFGSLTLSRSVVTANRSAGSTGHGAGVFNHHDSTLLVDSTTIHGNTSVYAAGGLYLRGNVTVVNSTISGNTARQGGGVYGHKGRALFINSTITRNTASEFGGGIRNWQTELAIGNTVVAENASHTGPDWLVTYTEQQSSLGNNLIGITEPLLLWTSSDQVGSPNARLDPQLGTLSSVDSPFPIHRPLPLSPVIDAGSHGLAKPIDQTDGSRRIGTAPDIGAIEYTPVTLPGVLTVDSAAPSADGLFTPGSLQLEEAVLIANQRGGSTEIRFADSLLGESLPLSGEELVLASDITLSGPGADQLTIDARGLSRIVRVERGAKVRIRRLTLRGGASVASDIQPGRGAGVLNQGKLNLVEVFLTGNAGPSEDSEGGAIYNTGRLTAVRSTIAENSAARGGGILNAGDATLKNVTLSTNSATQRGGNAFNRTGIMRLVNTTVALGVAGHSGIGGVYSAADAKVALKNTIVATNDDNTAAGDLQADGAAVTNGGNLIGAATSAIGFTPRGSDQVGSTLNHIDPLLTELLISGSVMPVHALLPASPAIDAGVRSPKTDQRQVKRPQGRKADLGAVEMIGFDVGSEILVDNLGDTLNGNYAAGDLTFREAILLANTYDSPSGTDRIVFSPTAIDAAADASGHATIALRGSQIVVTGDVIVEDPAAHRDDKQGAELLTISASGDARIFEIQDTARVEIHGVTLRDGAGTRAAGSRPGVLPGGAISNRGTLLLSGVVLEDNFSAQGGAVHNAGTLTIENSVLRNNSATTGGALLTEYLSDTTINRSVITDNRAEGRLADGGGIAARGPITIDRSEISHNTSQARGGGLRTEGLTTITYSTISNNRTLDSDSTGGGISSHGELVLTNVTIAENQTGSSGGGLHVSGTTTLTNTLVALNAAASAKDGWGSVTASNSLSGTAGFLPGGRGNVVQNPHLGPLSDNGGIGRTHQLRPGSPAIDGGVATTAIVDQRGRSLVDIPATGVGIPDIGAYEIQSVGSSGFAYSVRNQSQFGPGSAVVYGFGFDDGSAGSAVSPKPQFLGFQFDTGNLKAGHISEGAFGSLYGGEINADFAGRMGFDIGFYVNSGSLDVAFNGQHNYVVDADESGATVSNFVEITDGSLYTISPKVGAYADLVMQLQAEVSATGCFVGCATKDLIDLDLDHTLELFSMNRQMQDYYDRPMFFAVGNAYILSDGEYVNASGGIFARARNGRFYDIADTANSVEFYKITSDGFRRLQTPPVVPFLDGDIRYASVQLIVENALQSARSAQEFKRIVEDELKKRKAAKQVEDARQKENQASQDLDRLHNERAAAVEAQKNADTAGEWVRQRDRIEQIDRDTKGAEDRLIESSRERKRVEDEFNRNHKLKNGKRRLKSPTQYIQVEFSEADGSLLGGQADLAVGIGATTPLGNIGASKRIGSLQVTVPDINLRANEPGARGRLTASTASFPANSELADKQQLANLQVDIASLLGTYFGLPLGEYNVSLGPLSLDVTTVSYDLGPQLNVTQTVHADPVVEELTYQFFTIESGESLDHDNNPDTPDLESGLVAGDPIRVDVEIGGVLYSDVEEISFSPDQNVRVLNSNEPILVVPSMQMDTRVTNDLGLEVALKGKFEAFAMALSAFGYSVVDVDALLSHRHTFGTFDLGSVFHKTFELDNPREVGLAPFTLFESTRDGRTAAAAFEPPPHPRSQNRTYFETEPTAGQNVFVRTSMLQPESGTDGADRYYPTLKVTMLRGDAPSLVQVTDDRLSVRMTDTGFEIDGFTADMLDETEYVTFAMLFDTPGSRKIRTQRWQAIEIGTAETTTENRAELDVEVLETLSASAVLTTDVDGDGVSRPDTDGVLFQRYVDGVRGAGLTANALGENAVRQTPDEIADFISGPMDYSVMIHGLAERSLDFDGNGKVDSFDATLFSRYVAGLRGSDLVNGATAPDATRRRSRDVIRFIELDRADVSERNDQQLEQIDQTTDDIFGLRQAFDISRAMPGSSAWSASEPEADGSITLPAYRRRVRFEEVYYQSIAAENLLSRTAENNPAEFGPKHTELLETDADANGIADVFENGIDDASLKQKVLRRRLGVQEPIYIRHSDAAAHELAVETGHVFDSVVVDRRVDGNLYLSSAFDVFVHRDGDWQFLETISETTHGLRDGLLELRFTDPVARFRLYSTQLPNESVFGASNGAAEDFTIQTGFTFSNPNRVSGKPRMTVTQIGERPVLDTPEPVVVRTPHQGEQLTSSRVLQRSLDQLSLSDSETAENLVFSVASTTRLTIHGNDSTSDTLVIDGSGGPIHVPLTIDAGGRQDTVRIDGSGIELDLIAKDQLQGVETIDLRGTGSNTLIIDSDSVLTAQPETRSLRIIKDTDDNLTMVGSWQQTGVVSEDGLEFEKWVDGAATILVADAEGSNSGAAFASAPAPGFNRHQANDALFGNWNEEDELFV